MSNRLLEAPSGPDRRETDGTGGGLLEQHGYQRPLDGTDGDRRDGAGGLLEQHGYQRPLDQTDGRQTGRGAGYSNSTAISALWTRRTGDRRDGGGLLEQHGYQRPLDQTDRAPRPVCLPSVQRPLDQTDGRQTGRWAGYRTARLSAPSGPDRRGPRPVCLPSVCPEGAGSRAVRVTLPRPVCLLSVQRPLDQTDGRQTGRGEGYSNSTAISALWTRQTGDRRDGGGLLEQHGYRRPLDRQTGAPSRLSPVCPAPSGPDRRETDGTGEGVTRTARLSAPSGPDRRETDGTGPAGYSNSTAISASGPDRRETDGTGPAGYSNSTAIGPEGADGRAVRVTQTDGTGPAGYSNSTAISALWTGQTGDRRDGGRVTRTARPSAPSGPDRRETDGTGRAGYSNSTAIGPEGADSRAVRVTPPRPVCLPSVPSRGR